MKTLRSRSHRLVLADLRDCANLGSVQNASQPAAKPVGQTTTFAQQSAAASSDQPMSVADLARAAGAKRQQGDPAPAPHIAKVLDDDNMLRGVYPAEPIPAKPAAAGGAHATDSANSTDSPFPEFRGTFSAAGWLLRPR